MIRLDHLMYKLKEINTKKPGLFLISTWIMDNSVSGFWNVPAI